MSEVLKKGLIMRFIDLISLLLLLGLMSCASSSRVKISSSPDKAEVKVTTNDGETKSLGVTPLDI